MRSDELLTGRRIPVYTLTGFLGSGKTSFLTRLLEHPRMARTAVIVNEFGDVGLDQLTIRQVDEQVRLLAHGCLCCLARDDLLETLRTLYADQLKEGIEVCDRVIIETSGMADPIPVVHTMLADPLLQERFIYRGTLVTVDLLQPADGLLARVEGARQVAAADLFVLTKADLAPASAAGGMRPTLQRLNPIADVLGNEPAALDEIALRIAAEQVDCSSDPLGATDWLLAALGRAGRADKKNGNQPFRRNRIAHERSPVESYVLRLEEAVRWPEFTAWLQRLLSHNQERLLRLKGVVEVDREPEPIVVQAVRQLFHPCYPLPRRPGDERGSRLVLIVDNQERSTRRDLGVATLGAEIFCASDRAEPTTMEALERALL